MPWALRVRRAVAVAAARLTAAGLRVAGRGGTALPGLVAVTVDPAIVRGLSAQLPRGSIVVSGTNGKTTTCRMLATILAGTGYRPVRNESGSNLMRGLASALIRRAGWTGNLRTRERDIGVFEADEAALPAVLSSVRPTSLALLDLFRDQLDRYGEVATVAGLWARSLEAFNHGSLVANADDPLVADVARAALVKPTYFGVESAERTTERLGHAADVKACPRCGGSIAYSAVFLGHLGHWRCPSCSLERPRPAVWARDVRLRGVEGSSFRLGAGRVETHVDLPLPGMYNVYNALAAAAVGHALGLGSAVIAGSLATVTPAFGRMERIELDGRSVYLALAKNPAGLNEVLRTLTESSRSLHLLVMLNDNAADGKDVSWIWDANVEMLAGAVSSVVFSGRRAEDMALRFKYAGLIDPEGSATWRIEHDTSAAFRAARDGTPADGTLFVVPTYTALLDIRGVLVKMGLVSPYWEE